MTVKPDTTPDTAVRVVLVGSLPAPAPPQVVADDGGTEAVDIGGDDTTTDAARHPVDEHRQTRVVAEAEDQAAAGVGVEPPAVALVPGRGGLGVAGGQVAAPEGGVRVEPASAGGLAWWALADARPSA